MTRRRILSLGLLGLALAGALYLVLNPTYTVRISQAQLQETVDKRMPLTGKRYAVSYEISGARAEMRPDGRIGMDAIVKATAVRRTAEVHVTGSGVLSYVDGSFFLKGFDVEKADLIKADTKPEDKRLLARALERVGVEDGDAFLSDRREAIVEKVREVGTNLLRSTLETRPVYVMKSDTVKQSLAKLALSDVKVENGELVVKLDFLGLAMRLLLWGVIGVLCLAAAVGLLRSPGGLSALSMVSLSD